ncbi:MAG: glycosyltransferase family 2 protein [Phycisphaerales bacterium]|nr:glycosyltransferase family 2 protein [Phycisphaerales bacterium]
MSPRFSIVLPTLRRSGLLAGAMRSVLTQTLGDFELIVSNNADDADTARVALAPGDPRVRLVTPGRLLSMHDHWAFALKQARGTIVSILSDDDALHPRALEIVDRVATATDADVLFWRSCAHYAADWPEPGVRGRLDFGPPFTDAWCPVDPAALIDHAFQMHAGLHAPMPRMLGTAVTARTLARAEASRTPLFVPSCPDYAAALAVATHADGMCFLDTPLYVSGATARSIGTGSVRRAEVAQAFIDDLLEREPDLPLLPAMVTPSCWIAQTYEECVRRMPPLAGRVVNRTHVYAIALREIEMIRASGGRVDDLEATLDAAFAGPLARIAEDARRLFAADAHLHGEAYIGPPAGGARLLGHGPFFAPSRPAEGGTRSIDAAAAAVDGWLRDRAVTLDVLPTRLRRAARGRAIVLYGLGRRGIALGRILTPAFGDGLLGCDDGAVLSPQSITRINAATLDPHAHFVLITPEAGDAVAARLRHAGFADADSATLRTLLRNEPAPRVSPPAAPART